MKRKRTFLTTHRRISYKDFSNCVRLFTCALRNYEDDLWSKFEVEAENNPTGDDGLPKYNELEMASNQYQMVRNINKLWQATLQKTLGLEVKENDDD